MLLDLELMYLCTGTTLKVDSTVTKLPKIDGCCSDAADPDYVEEDGTFLYSHLCDVPVSISMYSTLSTVVIDAWDFHRGGCMLELICSTVWISCRV